MHPANRPARSSRNDSNSANNDSTAMITAVGSASSRMLNLRPKPNAPGNSAAATMRPPPSPATRRLFLRGKSDLSSDGENNNSNKLLAPSSFDTAENGSNNSSNTLPMMSMMGDNNNSNNNRTIDPSSSNDQNDISGDWSEATSSIRSLTNERIRMSNVPSHVNTTSRLLNHSGLDGLEEEIEADTVVMEEDLDDDDDDSRNRLDDDDVVDADIGKSDLLGEAGDDDGIRRSDSMAQSLSGTKLNFNSPPPGGEPGEETTISSGKQKDPHGSLESSLHPHTPRGFSAEQSFHIHNLEVSPIVRLPEDDDHEMVDGSLDEGIIEPKVEERRKESMMTQPLFRELASPILANKSSEGLSFHQQSNEDACADTSANSASTMFSTGDSSDVNTTASTANINNTTLNMTNMSNISRPTARKLRPMPDTSAFDLGTPSQHSLGSKDSGFNSHQTGATGSLLCPPTPIRTPAWAHAAGMDSNGGQIQPGGLTRANSLISTKVLAACPSRVLDNLSSLEDSMLENDISGSTMDSTADRTEGSHVTNPAGSSFAPVMEESGYSSFNESGFRSLEDHASTSDQILPTSFYGSNQKQEAMPSDMQMKSDGGVPPSPAKQTKYKSRVSMEEPADVDMQIKSDGGGPLSPTKPIKNRSRLSIDVSADPVTTFSDFHNLGILGSGAFADVYKVRSKKDRRLYAIKKTRRQFRGVKDRERAMAEVHTMKRLQNALLSEAADSQEQQQHHHSSSSNKNNYGLYLLFFIRAWQQEGFFYCQTELCSRATCRHLRLSLWSDWERDVIRYPSLQSCVLERGAAAGNMNSSKSGDENHSVAQDRLIPEQVIWQMCHDISRGLFHIHSYSMVHYDIKPSNIFFVANSKWGTICKIGDFGLTGDVGTKDDGQEGDTVYMPSELLKSSCAKHPGADIFSLGLALYEMAASPSWSLPREGDRWHELRNGEHTPDLPSSRSTNLIKLIQDMIRPDVGGRPTAEEISELDMVKRANATSDSFLSRYINDVERYDSRREREMESAEQDARRRSTTPTAAMFNNHSALGNETMNRRASRDLRTPTHTYEDG